MRKVHRKRKRSAREGEKRERKSESGRGGATTDAAKEVKVGGETETGRGDEGGVEEQEPEEVVKE